MEEIEYGEFLRLDGGKIVRYGEKQDIRVENNRYIDYSGEYEWETHIVKHSSNIIDLVEVGDFINGKMCIDIEHYTRDDGSNGINFVCIGGSVLKENIKSICTKEQFENAEYKLDI